MADQRTMTELLCAPTEGYAETIVVPPILAEHFELKHSLINLVTSKQFFGFEKEDLHAHIRYFNKITSTLKYKYVPETSIKLMFFPFSIDDPPELELKDLPSHLEYAFLEGTDKLPVIISKELKDEEKAALLKVLKSYKRAIAWKISDIKGIDPSFFTHKILMEDDFKPAIQHQRRVNPKIHEVIKKEVIKLLDA
ncbi:hypothetical protein Tco_0843193 [Tanacetum coccineum]|uniref:Reverse transcriptase domain-containing protein n=1 Tax=Tanacetum coccineum TaxID=301880 RepID=A0ABQ5B5I3_9ASTR